MRIVVKVGSGVISSKGGRFQVRIAAHIVDQIVSLADEGREIILITSGAVAMGKGMLIASRNADAVVQKQVFASVGQVSLMSSYSRLLRNKGWMCAQVLVTKEDFRDKQHYLNMRNCLENLLLNRVIPIINENDVVAVTELLFTDNDELAGLVASQINADMVIILSSVPGILDGDPHNPYAAVIPEISFDAVSAFEKYVTGDRSESGRGGMRTKFGIAKKLAAQGIAVCIADGKRKNVIQSIVKGDSVGTKFLPSKKVSSVKRRLAHSEGFSRGAVRVNLCMENILLSRKVVSLLPVGISEVCGDFDKGDVIAIQGKGNNTLGFGIARYDSKKAGQLAGRKNMSVFIHYDSLFLL